MNWISYFLLTVIITFCPVTGLAQSPIAWTNTSGKILYYFHPKDHPSDILYSEWKSLYYIEPTTGMTFIKIPAGCIKMRRDLRDPTLLDEICFDSFWDGIHEVTFEQFSKFSGKDVSNDERNHPATVTWNEAQRFITWLNKKSAKYKFRLPTEQEWEYATAAGTTGLNPWNAPLNSLCNHANINDSDTGLYSFIAFCNDGYNELSTAPVGSFTPNKFGLYDTIGNVWEWTRTKPYLVGPHRYLNSKANYETNFRICKGGSFNERDIWTGSRFWQKRDAHSWNIGFRLIMSKKTSE